MGKFAKILIIIPLILGVGYFSWYTYEYYYTCAYVSSLKLKVKEYNKKIDSNCFNIEFDGFVEIRYKEPMLKSKKINNDNISTYYYNYGSNYVEINNFNAFSINKSNSVIEHKGVSVYFDVYFIYFEFGKSQIRINTIPQDFEKSIGLAKKIIDYNGGKYE